MLSSVCWAYLILSPLKDHTISHPSGHNKMSPMRLVQWAKTPGREDTMAEVNRKMQRALEEALMKNIHLQEVCVYLFILLYF